MSDGHPRVLHINLARGWRGGEQQTWLLMQALAARGYRQGLCAYPDEPLAKAVRSLKDVSVLSPWQCLLSPWMIGVWDVSHAHEARGVYLAWWLKRLRGMRYVVTRRMQQPPKNRAITRRAYQQADRLVGISSAACAAVQSFCPQQTVHRIPSSHSSRTPQPAASADIRRQLISEPDATLIGHAGALRDAHKGQRVLIDAVQRLRARGYPVELVFFGEGADRESLERETSGFTWVRFVGQVSPIQDYLGALDLFAFPSRHEGLGSVLLEAMLAGVPVVATRVGGIPDLIVDSTSGLLVEPNNAAALSDALASLIDEPDLARQLSNHGLHVAESMNAQAMATAYAAIYENA